MLNNSETITINSTLTKIGKKRLAEKNFDISKVAFSDDGINYTLINDNLSDDDILIKRTPLLDVWKSGHLGMRNKILVNGDVPEDPNNSEKFNILFSESGKKSNNNAEKFPKLVVNGIGKKSIIYEGYDSIELNQKSTNKISFNFDSIFDGTSPRYLTVTLFDSTYFDIALTSQNMKNYLNMINADYLSADLKEELSVVPHNQSIFQALEEGTSNASAVLNDALSRNFVSAYFIDHKTTDNVSKTINVSVTQESDDSNSFSLYYKGNFDYKNVGVENHQTFLEILDERTGRVEFIRLSLIPN